MFSSTDKTTEQKRLLVEKATKIIESTKKDLIELFGTDESKIEVVYHVSKGRYQKSIYFL
jgi:hypothetical protein